jgi:membrane protease YdiL (CAAX protease family)
LGWAVAFLLGFVFTGAALFLNLSNMGMAAIALGVIGFAGGWSHIFLVRWVTGRDFWKHTLHLPPVWALAFIAGGLALFGEMGTACKMTALSLHSFSAAGAFVGIATAEAMRPLFTRTYAHQSCSCILIWPFSLGVGAVGGDLVGEGLSMFLSPVIAWASAIVVTVIIVGVGGGFSLICFLRPENGSNASALKAANIHDTLSEATNGGYLGVWMLGLLCAAFYLNDFADIYVTDWRLWILIDYTSVKLFPIVVGFWLIHTGRWRPPEFGRTTYVLVPFLTAFLVGTLTITFIVQYGPLFLKPLPGFPPVGEVPVIESTIWRWVDSTIGLLMVGVCEEFVFRGCFYTVISRYTRRYWIYIGVSALAFGFIHWSGGLHKVMVTGAAGAVLMAIYLQTRSLFGIILSHFTVDLIVLSHLLTTPLSTP